MKRQANSALAAAIASILLPASHSMAQNVLEEIIVTAERRATSEQTTAISMNVLTADDLASNRTQTIADLQQTTPNVTINNPGSHNAINIRGIGSSALSPAINVGVAVFQDGLLNAETITLSSQFLDLDTAEVLRGPQGTFVGTASTGGAIRLNSVRPSLEGDTNGYVEALLGSQSNTKITGAVNLPISATFAARLAFNQEQRNSYFYSKGTIVGVDPQQPFQQQGQVDDKGGRISLLWAPSDDLEMIFRAEMNRSNNGGAPFQPNPRTFLNVSGQPTHSRYWNYDDPAHDPEVLAITQLDTKFITVVDRYSMELNYSFDNDITFRSLTGFVHNENRYIEDQDGSTVNGELIRNNVGPDNNYYTQEFNLISPEGPFNWIVGASWFYRSTPVEVNVETYSCGTDPSSGLFTPCPPQFTSTLPTLVVSDSETTVRHGGVFGQMNWEFVENLELTLGVRYNVDRNYSHGRDRAAATTIIIPNLGGNNCPADVRSIYRYSQIVWNNATCVFTGVANSYEDETPTWKVGLNWGPNDDNFIYAFWARGYKSGGVDGTSRFEHEEVDDYEIGWKRTFAGGRAQFNLGAFYMDYQNMQQQAYRATAVNAGNGVFNVGESTIQGIEAEFNGRFGGFGFQTSVGWVDSELGDIRLIDRTLVGNDQVRVTNTNQDLRQCAAGETPALVPGGCVDWTPYYKNLSGERNVFSPEWQYSASASYDFVVGNGTWTPRITYSYTDESDINLIRREAFWTIEERELVTLSLTYTLDDWLVQAYCNNCTDETYIASMGSGGGVIADSVIYGNPLNYGIRVRRSF